MTTLTEQNSPAATAAEHDDIADDLEQLYELATLVTAARDAMSDEMVNRMSSAFSEGLALLDRLTRNQGLMHLLRMLDRPESQIALRSLGDAIGTMSRELATAPPVKGGITGLLRLARKPGTQEGLRVLSLLGKHWNENLRDMHRRGG